MGHIIAVAGKGGVGKTTLCGLMIQYLCEHGKKPVLAVDADANSNLNEVLGVADAIVEEDDFDFMVMGRTQGQGCYCFVNGLVQTQIQKLQSHYPYVVVDNEAGMEHVSRGLLPSMKTAVLVSDCSRRGVQAAGRISELMKELGMKPEKTGVIINRAPEGRLDEGTKKEIEKQGLTLLGVIPQDEMVYRYDCDGKPLVELPEETPIKKALYKILEEMGL